MNAVVAAPRITVKRRIEASAEQLFDAWLDAESLAQWMRPGSILRTQAKVDPRVGGAFEITMHGADETYPHTGVYRLIDRPNRLVFTWISPATERQESLVTVEFLPRAGGATEVIVTHEQLPNEEALQAHTGGWTQALERLATCHGPAVVS